MQNLDDTATVNSTTSATLPSTAELEETVKVRLNGRVRGFRLLMETEGLILRGKTRTYYAKQLAQQMVMSITTLRIQANEIEVLNGEQP
jgi:hypothetical protein